MNSLPRSLRILAVSVSISVIVVSLFGLIDQTIYANKSNSITLGELFGQDLVSLLVGIACLFTALLFNQKIKFSSIFVLGCMFYFVYIYGYFSFSILNSRLYLIYCTIFSTSFFTLFFNLMRLGIQSRFLTPNKRYPAKSIAVFFMIVVIIMLIIEIPTMVHKTIIENNPITLFEMYYILDLTLVFPAMIILGILNFNHNRFCILPTGIMLIKLVTLMPALICNDVFHYIQSGKLIDPSFDIIATIFMVSSGIFYILYWKGIVVTQLENTAR